MLFVCSYFILLFLSLSLSLSFSLSYCLACRLLWFALSSFWWLCIDAVDRLADTPSSSPRKKKISKLLYHERDPLTVLCLKWQSSHETKTSPDRMRHNCFLALNTKHQKKKKKNPSLSYHFVPLNNFMLNHWISFFQKILCFFVSLLIIYRVSVEIPSLDFKQGNLESLLPHYFQCLNHGFLLLLQNYGENWRRHDPILRGRGPVPSRGNPLQSKSRPEQRA